MHKNALAYALALGLSMPWLLAPGCPEVDSDKPFSLDTGATDDLPGEETTSAEGCAALRSWADERMDQEEIGCIEGTFEDRGYPFDAEPCDELEGMLAVGFGGFDGLWRDCQSDEGFGDSDCDAVLDACR